MSTMGQRNPLHLCELWPKQAIDESFAEYIKVLGRPPRQEDYMHWGFENLLREYYGNKPSAFETFNEKPISQIKYPQMIRLRGMVQEVGNPEYFHSIYREYSSIHQTTSLKTAKYIETLDDVTYLQQTMDVYSTQQRTPTYIVPIPGETSWARAVTYPKKNSLSSISSSSSTAWFSRSKTGLEPMDEKLSLPSRRRGRRNRDDGEQGDQMMIEGDGINNTNHGNSNGFDFSDHVMNGDGFSESLDTPENVALAIKGSDLNRDLKNGDANALPQPMNGADGEHNQTYLNSGGKRFKISDFIREAAESAPSSQSFTMNFDHLTRVMMQGQSREESCEDEDELLQTMIPDLNFPIPSNFGSPCVAKFYHPHSILPNQIVECIGVIWEPAVTSLATPESRRKLLTEPAPMCPRFHVVISQDLGEANPLIPPEGQAKEELKSKLFAQMDSIRDSLLSWISSILGGDNLAALYFLYCIISRVQHRFPEGNSIGNIPINFIGCNAREDLWPNVSENNNSRNSLNNEGSGQPFQLPLWTQTHIGRIEHILEILVPKRHTIPINEEYLSIRKFCPQMSLHFSRLDSGELQLAAGTVVVFDETRSQGIFDQLRQFNDNNNMNVNQSPTFNFNGNLSDTQVKHLGAISRFITQQEVAYNFEVYPLDFPVDCPCIVVSEGISNLANIVCTIPLHSNLGFPDPEPVPDYILNQWRAWISLLREVNIDCNQAASFFEEDFVEIRKQSENSYLTPELFSLWISLVKAASAIHGETEVTRERWASIKEMESQRLSRL